MNGADFTAHARLDLSQIDQIVQLESVRPGLLKHLIGVFERNFTALMQRLPDQLEAGEQESLRVAFHSLKGAAASLGVQRLSTMAGVAESLAADGAAAADFDPLIALMEEEFAAVQCALGQASAERMP